jgi:hypothetical protein
MMRLGRKLLKPASRFATNSETMNAGRHCARLLRKLMEDEHKASLDLSWAQHRLDAALND